MKIKLFSQVNRCNIFLDIWLSYYCKIVRQENIHLFYENKFNQDIREYLNKRNYSKVQIIYVPSIIKLDYFNKIQFDLLQQCDVLLYADPDEIIFAENLLDLLQSDFHYLTTTGFEIIHDYRKEAAYNENEKIIKQRKFGIFSISYNKPLILKKSLPWTCTGKHSKGIKMNLIQGLYLIHLCRFDIYLLLELNKQNKKTYQENQIKCWHHLICDFEELQQYYSKYFLSQIIEIPEEIKKINI